MDVKKHFGADLEKKKKSFLAIGLLFSLAIVLAAFEFRTIELPPTPIGEIIMVDDFIDIIPVSFPKPPPPPPPPPPTAQIEIVKNNVTINKSIEIIIPETSIDTKINYTFPVLDEPEDELKEDDPFRIVGEMPQFLGGEEALFKYLAENIKYPPMAIDAGVKGKVYVTFVVEKNGSISDVKILHGIGGGCDQEAIRVVMDMPLWSPGKQRGKPVRVQYNLPINFILR